MIVGGDGSFFEVANGLLRRADGQRVPLGLLPGGSGNSILVCFIIMLYPSSPNFTISPLFADYFISQLLSCLVPYLANVIINSDAL